MRHPAPGGLLLGGLLLGGLVLTAAPAAAENPVFDDATAADITDALDDATAVQGICYGVRLDVLDDDTGRYSGQYTVSSSPPAAAATPTVSPAPESSPSAPLTPITPVAPVVCRGYVFLEASINYAYSYGESEDSASWQIDSDLQGAPTVSDLESLGLSARDLLDDGRSEQTLLNAALALPSLTAEKVLGVVPLVLVEATDVPPAEARATDTPGSDRIRESGTSLVLLVLLVVGGLLWAGYAAFRSAPTAGPGPYGMALRTAFGSPPAARYARPPDPSPTDPETP